MTRISRQAESRESKSISAIRRTTRQCRQRALALEHLEERRLLTAVKWINPGSGSWATGTNWDKGSPPTAGDDVTIPALASNVTITHSAGADTVHTINTGTNVVLSGGTLTVTSTLQVATGVTVNLQGGTLASANLTSGSTVLLTASGGTLAGVTVAAGATVDATQNVGGSQAYAVVTGGLALNGALNLGKADGTVAGQLYFQGGSQALSGSGSVTLGGSTSNALYAQGDNGTHPVTLTVGVPVGGGSGTIAGYYANNSTDSVVLNSTVNVPSGQALTVGGAGWVNNGAITAASGATATLKGSFTVAGLGSFAASGGTVNLTGTLINAGATLPLSPALGAWYLEGGTVQGGTVAATGGSKLGLTAYGGFLAGVTVAAGAALDATQNVGGSQAYAYVTGGLALDGAVNLGKADGSVAGQLYFRSASQALAGAGAVTFGASAANAIYAQGDNGTHPVTLTVAVPIQGGSGTVAGYYINNSTDSVVLNSTVGVPAGQSMTVGGAGWANNSAITAAGATLSVVGAGWANNGTISAAGGTVNLGGSFTFAGLGSFAASGATVNLTGTLNNAAATLPLAPAIGAWYLKGGTVQGGTVAAAGGSKLELTGYGGTLAGVAVAAGATVDATQNVGGSQAYAYVTGGLALDGAVNLGKADGSVAGQLYFRSASQALAGAGAVTFGASAANAIYAQGDNGTHPVTLTVGVPVGGGSGTVAGYYINNSADSIILNGTVGVPSGQSLTVGGVGWANNSAITAAGATLSVVGAGWANNGTISAAGGTVNLGGSFTFAGLGSFAASGATVNLTGTLNNAAATLPLAPAIGAWYLKGGTVQGGTVAAAGGSKLELTGYGGTLAGVAVAAGATVDATQNVGGSQAYAYVTGGLALDGAVNLGKADGSVAGQLYFRSASQALAGAGAVTFGASAANAIYAQGDNGTHPVTLTVAVPIQGGSGTVAGYYINNSADSIILNGTVGVPSGQSLTVGGVGWANNSAITAAGATLSVVGAGWANNGTISAAGGTVNLGGSFTFAGLGSFAASGATVNLTGTLNNAAATLPLAPAIGAWYLKGGTVQGGTVAAAGGSKLELTGYGGTLAGVAVAAGATVDATQNVGGSQAYAYVTGGLALDGAVNLGKADGSVAGQLYFRSASQALAGAGAVTFGASAANAIYAQGDNGTHPVTLTVAVPIQGGSGTVAGYYINNSADSVVMNGMVLAATSGGTITLGGKPFTDNGTVSAQNGATVSLTSPLTLGGSGILTESPSSFVKVGSNLLATTTNPSQFNLQGTVTFNGSGTSASPQLLEAVSQDFGAVSAGFTGNSAFGSLTLSNNTYVKLVDQAHNAAGSGAEAVYANSVIIPAGTTLDLNGLNLYTRALQKVGTVNGSITVIPDSGPITLGTPTPGSILPAGNQDDWTFFERAGHSVTVTLNPGTAAAPAPLAPVLNWAQVQLLDASNNVLATATDTTAGSLLTLLSVPVPADGVYKIHVTAAPAHSASTGNYLVTAFDTTPTVATLNFNQLTAGKVAQPYAVDQWNFAANAGQSVQLHVVSTSAAGLTFTLNGPNGYNAFTDISADSPLITLPSAGTYTLIAHGLNGVTGSFAFSLDQTSVTDLPLGTPYNGTLAGSGQAQLFRVSMPTTQVLSVKLTDPKATDHTELYAQIGSPPTRAAYDYRFAAPGNNQSLLIPSAAAGTWYILVYAEGVPSASTFTLTATASASKVSAITPDHAGNAGPATLTLTGAGYVAGTTVALVAADNVTTYAPSQFSVDSYTQITATFPANIPAGTYSVRVTTGGSSDTLPAAFTLSAGGGAHLQTNLILPTALGRHAVATLYVQYANTGSVAMPAPLLVLSNPNNDRPLMTLQQSRIVGGFWTSALPDGFSTSLSILASGKTPGVLQPGESVSVPVYYAGLQQPWDFSHVTIPFNLGVINTTDTTPINWASLKSSLQPSWINSAAWTPVFNSIVAQTGTTTGSYVQTLDNNASYLGKLGESVTDVGQLWNFSVLQADGLSPIPTLASATDASMPTPGLSLSFGRSFGETINSRYQSGGFGLGWTVPWQTSLTKLPDGTVTLTANGGNQFRYQPDVRSAGAYFAASGDMNMLMGMGGGKYAWEQMDGTVTGFRADGKLDYVQDTNGNKITAGYNASGQLTSLTHSSGQSLTIAYNAAGLISTITDSSGRQTVYGYDAANQHLMSVQTPGGTTQYTYSIGNGAATQNSLTSIQYPDGAHRFFTYDALGRLASTTKDGNAELVNFTYDQPGEVTSTDTLGDASRDFFDDLGLLVKSQDALGNSTSLAYDPATLMVSKVTDPTGRSQSFTYDAMGNMISSVDQLGHKTLYTYGTFNRLLSLTDANGNKTAYAYDPSGNLLSTSYANGSVEGSTFDPLGDPLSFTNRNGQAIGYSYNAAGQVTKQTFPDTSHTDFAYDPHGNLKTATDASGTITFTYDSADRLTRIDYPNGMFLQFTLGTGGRRTKMVDQTGFTVNYAYDAAGRLTGLTDGGNNPTVTYTYDAAGRLSLKANGNGTTTTYQYDAAGNVLHLINYAPGGGTVNSRFDYTFNALGQRATMTSLDGTWTYAYDGTGQLTHAVFASNNPNIPSQDLAYNYDALGNRTSTVFNGVTTAYISNNLNQYTTVGGVAQKYDAAGNLLSDGTNTYTYDSTDRLTSVATPTGTTTFKYDALRNRSSSTTGGQVTRFLNDPLSLPTVVGEFDGAGNAVAHDTYGLGLTSRTAGSGTNYYDFDAVGNAVALTVPAGAAADTYSYLPFGGMLTSSAPVPNLFQFMGLLGVSADPGGLDFMRARDYSTVTGRFLNVDPIRYHDDGNVYRYSQNDPVDRMDATGTESSYVVSNKFNFFGMFSYACETSDNGSSTTSKCTMEIGFPFLKYKTSESPTEWCHGTHVDLVGYEREEMVCGPPQPLPPPPPAPPLPPPLFPPPVDNGVCTEANPVDPNDKLGPVGYGTPNFVPGNQFLPYRIDFENAPTATAPAQAVTVTDQLSPLFDWTTFRLTEIGWGDTVLTVPGNVQHYQTTVPMTYNGKTFNVLVEAGIHSDTGQVYTTFQSIDPNTQLPPDVLTGFLPPEPAHLSDPVADLAVPGRGRGMGHVSYTVRPVAGLATGTPIRNVAVITFDQNASIATDQVSETDPSQGTDPNKEALVTIDSGLPTSTVAPLPATETTVSFPVSWSGQDDVGGSGLASYSVYDSDNGGPFTLWQSQTTQTSATFTGVNHHTYAFYSVATDNAGNVQPTPASGQSTTQILLPPLYVATVTPNATGAVIHFNRSVDITTSHLYGPSTLGPADLTLVGASVGPLAGSLLFNAAGDAATFVRTGGVLPADSYTLTLLSGAKGFKDLDGNQLDGNADGTPGDNYATAFIVTPSTAVVVGLPDFARGPGQPVNVPAAGAGFPLTVSDGTGITSLVVKLAYDPTLLTVTGAALAAGMPAGGAVTADTSTPGLAVISYSGPALPAGPDAFATVSASVPASAPYLSKEVLSLTNPSVNGGAVAAVGDSSVHVVGYPGDVSGNGVINSFDSTLVQRYILGSDSGFAASKDADPLILGDVSGNGVINSFDRTLIQQYILGQNPPQIPSVPNQTLTQGGPDPVVSLPRDLAVAPGGMVSVPVDFRLTAAVPVGLESFDLAIAYDPSAFSVSAVQAGSLTAGFSVDWSTGVIPGLLYVSASRVSGPVTLTPGATGTLAVVDLVARPGAKPGVQPLNLLNTVYGAGGPRATELDDSGLTLHPAPTNAADDPVDGSVMIVAPKPPVRLLASPAVAPAATDAAIESVWGRAVTHALRDANPTAAAPGPGPKARPPRHPLAGAAAHRLVVNSAARPRVPLVFDKVRR